MKIFRITTNTTTEVTASSGQLIWLRLVVTGSPSAWVITVQNKETPAKIFYVSDSLSAPATIQVEFPLRNDRTDPVPMTGGIDIVPSGTTPGVLNAWVEWKPTQS
jgi:hypothetical protein